ncbi:DUF3006 domain-containing protein [Tepidimicrobium xylanilyticum]|uniref:DUF3006 domain-containing protein n=1 Tax=Tepidimicrobium xylanilyticum TaxID=1123352 RepID=UPI002652DE9F|nr:DUF3006 domain-containing protein [Tepidimicrobium xylanilyticum]GMG97808.1 hypothetical protein EN5CB1_26340 [Tepidimicrobium xylanilyticum]
MKGIVDRFEEDRVVIEILSDGGVLEFDRVLFPDNLKEGDVVEYIKDRFVINEEETRERGRKTNDLFNSLIKK